MATAGNTFDNIAHKLIDEQLASDINHMLELVETGTIANLEHIDRVDNPHKVTKEQVGLGNVDNTADMDKPVSNAVSSAINSFKEENSREHSEIHSAINTLKEENSREHSEIHSAINTLKEENSSEIEKAKEEINKSIDNFYNRLSSAVNTLKDSNSAAHTTLQQEINNTKSELQSAINTLETEVSSAINTLDKTVKALNFTDKEIIDITQADTFVVTGLDGGTKRVSKKDISSNKPITLVTEIDSLTSGLYVVHPYVQNTIIPQEIRDKFSGDYLFYCVETYQLNDGGVISTQQLMYVSALTIIIKIPIAQRCKADNGPYSDWAVISVLDLSRAGSIEYTSTISTTETLVTADSQGQNISRLPVAELIGEVEEKTLSKLEDRMYSLIYRNGWEKGFLDEVPNLKNIIPLDRVSIYGKNIAAIPDNYGRGVFLTTYDETTGAYNSVEINESWAMDIATGKNYTLFCDDETLVCIDHSKDIKDNSTYIKPNNIHFSGDSWSIQRIPSQDVDEFIIMSGNIDRAMLEGVYKYTPKTNTLEKLPVETGGAYGVGIYPQYLGTFFYLNNAKTIVFVTPAQAIVYNADNMEENYEIMFRTSTGYVDTVLSDFVQLDDSTIGALYKDTSNNLRLLTISNNDLVTHKPADGTRWGRAVLADFTQYPMGMSYVADEKLVLRKLSDNYFAAHYKTANIDDLRSCDFTIFKWDNNKVSETTLMNFKDLVITQESSGIGFLGYNNFGLMWVAQTNTGYMTYKTALNKFNI